MGVCVCLDQTGLGKGEGGVLVEVAESSSLI